MVEIAGTVNGNEVIGGCRLMQQVELDLGMHHHGESHVGCTLHSTFQRSSRIGSGLLTVGGEDIAQHACNFVVLTTPR